jgi:hypothetical protein
MSRKSQEVFRYKYHKNYDVQAIKNEVFKLEEEWFKDTSRQDFFDVHKETTTVFLTDSGSTWEPYEPYAGSIREPESLLYRLVEPIIKDLEQLHNGKVGKAILTKLKAGKKVNGHTDRGNYLDISRRNHIPITTNNKVFFAIGEGLLNMYEGECWEINNMQYHEVINDSEEDRIHLIIDIIPNEYIGR